ncbi:MAG: ParA family protein [Alphaproteobacteria bacterium]
MAKIFSIVNQKGGVGKTTTAINLAASIAAIQKKILLVDFDPQGNATTGLSACSQKRQKTIYDLLFGPNSVSENCIPTVIPGLDLLPASQDLSAAEVELASLENREAKLKTVLFHVEQKYDYIFVDCPPSLGLLTINALAASHKVLVPMQCEFFALEGLSHLLATLQKIKKNINTNLELQGIVLTMYDRRNLLNQQVAEDVYSHFKQKVYKTPIPRNIKIPEASSFGKPIIIYDLKSAGSRAYLELAKEFLEREKEF